MTPTPELRFVEREAIEVKREFGVVVLGGGTYKTSIKILQQKWIDSRPRWDVEKQMLVLTEEWRDVPMVKENP